MHGPLDTEVTAELASRFSAQDIGAAKRLLESTSLPLLEDTPSLDRARIHMAAIKLANGSLKKFEQALILASSDWRDLLVSAGLAGADWRHVLAKEGFRVPEGK